MTQVSAVSKRIDFRKGVQNKRRFLVLVGLGALLTIFTVVLYGPTILQSSDALVGAIFSAFVVLVAISVIISWIVWPPKKAMLDVNNTRILFADNVIAVEKVESWALVELSDTVEIIINKGGYGPNLEYFYTDSVELKNSGVIDELNKLITYDADLVNINKFHFWLRRLGLR